jgi:hypothetical protein
MCWGLTNTQVTFHHMEAEIDSEGLQPTIFAASPCVASSRLVKAKCSGRSYYELVVNLKMRDVSQRSAAARGPCAFWPPGIELDGDTAH